MSTCVLTRLRDPWQRLEDQAVSEDVTQCPLYFEDDNSHERYLQMTPSHVKCPFLKKYAQCRAGWPGH